jgi:hypothetical protein
MAAGGVGISSRAFYYADFIEIPTPHRTAPEGAN